MAAINMPVTPGFTDCRFFLETNTQKFESPITKTVQRVLLGGSRWNATYSLPAMKSNKASEWVAFFMLLEGSTNTFNAYNPDRITPRGSASITPGTPLVNGGSQTGSSLIIDGAPASKTGWLLPGDNFSVNSELKMVTSQVNTDGSGNATINFKPALRGSPADNAALTLTKPTCTMILPDDMQAYFDVNKNGVYMPKTFTAFEVFS